MINAKDRFEVTECTITSVAYKLVPEVDIRVSMTPGTCGLIRASKNTPDFGGRIKKYAENRLNSDEANKNTFPEIKKVIFNYPATIVFFADGTKTVVKCKEDEEFSPWAGVALCITKRLYGDDFHKKMKLACKDYVAPCEITPNHTCEGISSALEEMLSGLNNIKF